jgi:hypothetical protein
MKLNTARAKQIDAYLETHPDAKIDDKIRVSYGGQVHIHQVYKIPLKYLIYNIRNGRFGAELLEKEKGLTRKHDSTEKKDAEIIKELLLEQDAIETQLLKDDIKEKNQIEPGIITFDGAVINANRRMAILSVLFEETRDTQFSYLKVGRLPPGVDQVDLWRIEAGLQFGKDFRLQYGGVNELLKLREGAKQGLTSKDISVALLGRFSAKKVEEKLEILKLVESYLHFIGQPGEYYRIQEDRDLEKFNSLQTNVIASLKKKHRMKDQEIARLIPYSFTVIAKTDLRHWDIREMREIALHPKAYNEMLKPYKGRHPDRLSDVKASADDLKEAFTSAQDILNDHEQSAKPEKLLRRALRAKANGYPSPHTCSNWSTN